MMVSICGQAATQPSPVAPATTVQEKATTIDGITNLVREKLSEGLKTEVMVSKAAGAKAAREIQSTNAMPLGGTGQLNPYAPPAKKPKEEFLTIPAVASITGVGAKLRASLSNGKTVVPGESFPLGDTFVTVEGISKQAVTFKRCKKDKCALSTSKVSGF